MLSHKYKSWFSVCEFEPRTSLAALGQIRVQTNAGNYDPVWFTKTNLITNWDCNINRGEWDGITLGLDISIFLSEIIGVPKPLDQRKYFHSQCMTVTDLRKLYKLKEFDSL